MQRARQVGLGTYVKLDARSIFDIQKKSHLSMERRTCLHAILFQSTCAYIYYKIYSIVLLVMHPLKRLNVLNVLLNV